MALGECFKILAACPISPFSPDGSIAPGVG
jgi:hypothetical protein